MKIPAYVETKVRAAIRKAVPKRRHAAVSVYGNFKTTAAIVPIEIEVPYTLGRRWFDMHQLHTKKLKASTRKAYSKALNQFISMHPIPPSSSVELDLKLLAYSEELYGNDPRPASRQNLTNLLCFMYVVSPELRFKLSRTQWALASWKKIQLPTSALPITRHILLALVGRLVEAGAKESALAI